MPFRQPHIHLQVSLTAATPEPEVGAHYQIPANPEGQAVVPGAGGAGKVYSPPEAGVVRQMG